MRTFALSNCSRFCLNTFLHTFWSFISEPRLNERPQPGHEKVGTARTPLPAPSTLTEAPGAAAVGEPSGTGRVKPDVAVAKGEALGAAAAAAAVGDANGFRLIGVRPPEVEAAAAAAAVSTRGAAFSGKITAPPITVLSESAR